MSYANRGKMRISVVRPTFVHGSGVVYTAGAFLVLPVLLKRCTGKIAL